MAGLIAGPILGWLNPDALFGDLLFPAVSFSVAVILYEGGLSLQFTELHDVGGPLRNLVTIGAAVTWMLITVAARLLLGMDWGLAILCGAILVVTGPTVIGPLLRQERLIGPLNHLLKWEGILIDPIGGVLAVLVFEALFSEHLEAATSLFLSGVVKTAAVGLVMGLLAAGFLILVLRTHALPDHLQNPVSLAVTTLAYAFSNALQPEAGLLSVTVMGIALANQRWVAIRHIIEFKENLRVLLISTLFIVLAARLDLSSVTRIGMPILAFLAVLIFLIRPAAVILSTTRSSLTGRERFLLASVAPRGIVAATIASVFALRLQERGFPNADLLASVVFLTIIGTVAFYGLAVPLIARSLKISRGIPHGILIAGAHDWARALAKVLASQGCRVVLVDTNREDVGLAAREGLSAHLGSVLADEQIDTEGIGFFLGLTSNDEINSLASIQYAERVGRAHVFQLPAKAGGGARAADRPSHLRGRLLFGPGMTHRKITALTTNGWTFRALEKAHYLAGRNSVIPLVAFGESGLPVPVGQESPTLSNSIRSVVALVPPEAA
jgi:NhaP-type Na+/H+ or K+/H+ antiporter